MLLKCQAESSQRTNIINQAVKPLKVGVGLSGGVDSAVAALLLKQQGYEVIEEHKQGRTPNPDILCNRFVKFGSFLTYALKELRCDQIATGHYAATVNENGIKKLVKPKDANKDQTYFLSQLTAEQITHVIFPLAELTKLEVRTLAKNHGLTNHARKDSTGICFIGERNYAQFLQNYLPKKTGHFIDVSTNKIVGEHQGYAFYTIGQNKGLNLGGCVERYFVCGKNVDRNEVYVVGASQNEQFLNANGCTLTNLVNLEQIARTPGLHAKLRYRQQEVPVRFEFNNKNVPTI
ncbi:unnamed protein product [Didymodactylos carnosus]|uniref:tRNA-5-taurinomethyluridine 2-sulfurtransferase n=1 Tax=Didymodactylos carnosus TaxID=1234261 RepID=A0A8S2PRL0_9BILA|nr:unnamed protein product [Didymodactylos carnosus]CAF4068356.1 unnamed protein product [Didymodactylos carnosus]